VTRGAKTSTMAHILHMFPRNSKFELSDEKLKVTGTWS